MGAMRPCARLLVVVLACVGGPRANAAEKLDTKAIAALADRWFEARPKTCFEAWDHAKRGALLKEAEALGPLPEGSLAQVRDLLWKAVRKHAPNPKGEIDDALRQGDVDPEGGRGDRRAA